MDVDQAVTYVPRREHRRARRAGHADLEDIWTRDETMTIGLVDTYSTPTLLKPRPRAPTRGRAFVTNHFELDDMEQAYDVFLRAAETGALKVVLSRDLTGKVVVGAAGIEPTTSCL